MSTVCAGIYRHYKGQYYQVISVARHSESQEQLVVYQCLYGDYAMWVRPLAMFVQPVLLADGQQLPRFSLIKAHPTTWTSASAGSASEAGPTVG
jgi:hypothetical protein